MSPPRDDHEETRREQAADIAGLQADVRRLDEAATREHEYVEAVSERSKDTARTVQEIEVQAERTAGRLARLESDHEKGSERMAKIEGRVLGIEHWQVRSMGWIGGASFAAAIIGALIGKLLGL